MEAVRGPKTFSVSLNKRDYIISLADKKSSQDLTSNFKDLKENRKHLPGDLKTQREKQLPFPVQADRSPGSSGRGSVTLRSRILLLEELLLSNSESL